MRDETILKFINNYIEESVYEEDGTGVYASIEDLDFTEEEGLIKIKVVLFCEDEVGYLYRDVFQFEITSHTARTRYGFAEGYFGEPRWGDWEDLPETPELVALRKESPFL